MSWLYSIFLAGLALSSSQTPINLSAVQNADRTASYNVKVDETEHFDQTYPLTANGRVSLSNVNGSVIVEAWDRSEVRVEYTKTADSRERLADVDVRIDSRADAISVETNYDNWKRDKGQNWKFGGGKLDVEFHLMVPRGAMLNEVETVNGSVTVSDFTNFTKISAVNGTVKASNIRGTARLSTVNGEVQADFDRLEQGSRISLDTVNGRVALVIPSDANATLKADSLNGSITNDWNLPVRKGKYVGRDMYGKIGTGEIQIKLSSVNGGLAINRKNDGRPLSPATDLLPAKGKADDDWDGDMDIDTDVNAAVNAAADTKVRIDTAKINRQVAKSVKESQKAAAKAAVDVDAEMARIGPEIARATSQAAMANTAEIQRDVQEALRGQADAMRAVNAAFLPGVPRIETKSDTIPVKGVPHVNIEARECSVKVTGWDRSEVQYRVVQFSSSRSTSPLNVTETHTDSSVDIKVTQSGAPQRIPSFLGNREPVQIEVMVPKRSDLKIAADGEVRLQGVSGNLEVAAADGGVNVRDADGKLQVGSGDGRIRVIGFRGDIEAKSGSAPISLEGEFGSLVAQSGDGAVNITIPANAAADLESNSDSVAGDGVSVTRVPSKNDRNIYKIGSGGGPRFRVDTEGQVTLRSSASLTN